MVECICGADIREITSVLGEVMWVDSGAGLYCYPNEPDGGQATHEPYDGKDG